MSPFQHDRDPNQDRDRCDPRDGPVAIDAQILDWTGTRRDALVERFERLIEEGQLDVIVTPGVRTEIMHPHTPNRVKGLSLACVVLPPTTLTHAQKLDRIRVRAILRGDTETDKHEADAGHVCDAAAIGCRLFVTHDKRILRRRPDLARVFPTLVIVTLERLLDLFDAADEEADEEADLDGW